MGYNRFASCFPKEDSKIDLDGMDRWYREQIVLMMNDRQFSPSSLEDGDKGDNLLQLAASAGLGSVIDLWSDATPIDINSRGQDGETALLHACRSGHFDVAMKLLKLGADPSLQSTGSLDTPLHWLLNFSGGQAQDLASRLVHMGANANSVARQIRYEYSPVCNFEAGTPLHRAVGRGKVDAVDALLVVGAQADCTGGRDDGICPIYLAASLHYPEILASLLSSLQTENPATRPFRKLPLLIAAIHCEDLYGKKFSAILRHGESWLTNCHRTLDILLKSGASDHLHKFPESNGDFVCAGTTPLLAAAGLGREDVVQYLIDAGCNSEINKPAEFWATGETYTPAIKAIFSNRKAIFSRLLDNGADPTMHWVDNDGNSFSPVYVCSLAANSDTFFAERILAKSPGLPVDSNPRGWETPFALAVRSRCFTLAGFLLQNGSNVNAEFSKALNVTMPYPQTVLGFLIREQTRSASGCLKWLLKEAPHTKFVVSSEKGYTALHICALSRRWTRNEYQDGACERIAETLIDHFQPDNSQVNQKDRDGNTALVIATSNNNYSMVRCLIDQGGDPNVSNGHGYSPVEINAALLQILNDTDKCQQLVDKSDPRPLAKKVDSIRQKQLYIKDCFKDFHQ
jgi:ankyrin repeat protein